MIKCIGKKEIGKFVDNEIIPVEPAKHKKNTLKLVYEKGTGDVDFEIRFVDEDVKQKKNQK